MAPKRGQKRKETSSSQPTQEERDARVDAMFSLRKRPIVVEREFADDASLGVYRTERGWDDFMTIENNYYMGDKSVFYDFFVELMIAPTAIDRVPVRGKVVDISAHAINTFFNLPDIPNDEYTQYADAPLDTAALTLRLTGQERYLHPTWRFMPKKWLTAEAKMLNLFVSCCLMPTLTNSEVLRKRALLIYALMEGMTVDVGRVINAEIHAAVDAPRKGQSIGFPALITTLCIRAGAATNADTLDRIPWAGKIQGKDFHTRITTGAGSSRTAPPPIQSSSDEEDDSQTEREILDDRMVQMEMKVDQLQNRMEAFFTYQVAVNNYMMDGQQGERPVFPAQAPPPPPQP